jgi:hypothetical protein
MPSKDVPSKSLDSGNAHPRPSRGTGLFHPESLEDEVLTSIPYWGHVLRRYQLSHLTSYQFREMRGMLAVSPGPGHVLGTIGT